MTYFMTQPYEESTSVSLMETETKRKLNYRLLHVVSKGKEYLNASSEPLQRLISIT